MSKKKRTQASDKRLRETVRVFEEEGRNVSGTARALGVSRRCIQHRLTDAKERGLLASGSGPSVSILEQRMQDMQGELRRLRKRRLTEEEIRREIFKLAGVIPSPPAWVDRPLQVSSGMTGVPSIFFSDFHWGEVIDPALVMGLNQYNLEIAHTRLQNVIERSMDILLNHMTPGGAYPGLVIKLGGDMVSGDIHDELAITNEVPLMPSVVDLFGALIGTIDKYRQYFSNIWVVGVSGNHGRNTKKVTHKLKAYTNFDWLLYQLLEKWYEKESDVMFHVPAADDAEYSIYGHKYWLTHGDQFRGGTGFVGFYAPVSRGENKKRIATSTYGRPYQTLCLAHFHQALWLDGLIANGSLVGYNEFCMRNNFKFAPPKQLLWLTHPRWGALAPREIFAGDPQNEYNPQEGWVSWPEAQQNQRLARL